MNEDNLVPAGVGWPNVTAVIPAFNEAGRIGRTVAEVLSFVDEVIVVDDGSHDKTAEEAKAAGARVLRQAQNAGYIAAIKRGFAAARGEIVVTLDADGEFPLEQIPALVEPIRVGQADMVQGHREQVPRPSERALTWLAQRFAPVGDSGTGFRAVRADMAQQLELAGACICGVFSLEVISKGGHLTEIPIRLRSIDKTRRIAWYHASQFIYLIKQIIRLYRS